MMRRTLAALLLAATTAAPLAAQAQDWQSGRDRPQSREGRPDARPDRGGSPGSRMAVGQSGDSGREGWRGNRGDGRRDDGRRDDGRDRQPGSSVAVGGPSGHWQNRQPDWQRDRPNPRVESGTRWNNRDDRRGNDRTQWGNRDNRWDERGRWDNRDDQRDRWSRDWRNDRRYNWQNYRTSNRHIYRVPRYYGRPGYDYRRWSPGYRMPDYYYGSGYWISDPWQYRLPPAHGPYRWVRYYDDVVLINIANGLIEDIIYSFFYR
ncbi:RcnB family protein [Sphingomonas sp. KC8]|uniref:RcnB family protein n=1 Tax=Sphingomonas sp. KC8 TaxID=1030157 RepID=UPI0002F2D8E5|nr:RcnB family protein [Sphingomonas sp. KC8]ARS28069.1 hypothetical protein KC8_12370 [Sphingomonas sp. KC8]